jgi:tetratricopeptide (TPR) repeat protein
VIQNKNHLAGLYLLQSRLSHSVKDYAHEFESVLIANQTSPLYGPAVRRLCTIYIGQNELEKAEALLRNAFEEYSKHMYCRNWLDTRELLIKLYAQRGLNENCIQLLKESFSVQRLLSTTEEFPTTKSNMFFEGDIDGKTCKGHLVNGSGFNLARAVLQDGLETNIHRFYDFKVDNSPDLCMFYDLRFGGTIVKIESISYLMKIIQDNNKACLIQIDNGMKLSGSENAFPNLWFIAEDPSVKPVNLSVSSSLNLRRI